MIALYFFGALFFMGVGVMCEHYLGPQPKLSNEELMDAMQRIVAIHAGDYNKCCDMTNELQVWMETGDIEMGHLSLELYEIIENVRVTYHAKNEI